MSVSVCVCVWVVLYDGRQNAFIGLEYSVVWTELLSSNLETHCLSKKRKVVHTWSQTAFPQEAAPLRNP